MAGTFTVTTTPAVVAAVAGMQSFTNTGGSPILLTWAGGRSERLEPGGASITGAQVVMDAGGAVSAYTPALTSTLVVADIRSDRGLPGYGSVAVDDIETEPVALAPTGVVAETASRSTATLTTVAALTSGTLRLVAVSLRAGQVITSIGLTAIGAAVAPTNQWFGLFSSARAALVLTADDLTAAWGANAAKVLALTAPFTVSSSGLYYVGALVAAGTPPTLVGVSSTSVATGQAPSLGGNTADTGLTTRPALPFTAGAITASGLMPYAVLS